MNHTDYAQKKQFLRETADGIAEAKRPGYTIGSVDVLANFKRVAERMGVTPMQVWGVYFLKHIDAITALAKDPNIPQAEEITGRFADAHNYLDLGFALHEESLAERSSTVGYETLVSKLQAARWGPSDGSTNTFRPVPNDK